jgi:hypothetical protein
MKADEKKNLFARHPLPFSNFFALSASVRAKPGMLQASQVLKVEAQIPCKNMANPSRGWLRFEAAQQATGNWYRPVPAHRNENALNQGQTL